MNEPEKPAPPVVVPVVEEELRAGSRQVKAGSVRVRKKVERRLKSVAMPVVRDVVRVTRVKVDRPVDVMPSLREEGDILIVPVVEEEVVVQKRLILREEIHIERRQTRERVTTNVIVDREHAIIERTDADGHVIARTEESQPEEPGVLSTPHKSLVGNPREP